MPSPQKVLAGAYERLSFSRGLNYRSMTGKNVMFWIGGRTWRLDCSQIGATENGDHCTQKGITLASSTLKGSAVR